MTDQPEGHYPYQAIIDAYGDFGFRFADMSHRGSLLCLPNGMHGWAAETLADVKLEALAPVLELAGELELLLIGMGEDTAFLPPEIREAFRAEQVIVEAISTGSAISTYNVLLAENRAVAAALIAVERPQRTRRP